MTSSFHQRTLLSSKRGCIEVEMNNPFDKIGAFPVKRNFPFLRHLGIKSILYVLFCLLLTSRVLVPEEYPEDSIKFMKKYNIQLFKYPLVGNKVCT